MSQSRLLLQRYHPSVLYQRRKDIKELEKVQHTYFPYPAERPNEKIKLKIPAFSHGPNEDYESYLHFLREFKKQMERMNLFNSADEENVDYSEVFTRFGMSLEGAAADLWAEVTVDVDEDDESFGNFKECVQELSRRILPQDAYHNQKEYMRTTKKPRDMMFRDVRKRWKTMNGYLPFMVDDLGVDGVFWKTGGFNTEEQKDQMLDTVPISWFDKFRLSALNRSDSLHTLETFFENVEESERHEMAQREQRGVRRTNTQQSGRNNSQRRGGNINYSRDGRGDQQYSGRGDPQYYSDRGGRGQQYYSGRSRGGYNRYSNYQDRGQNQQQQQSQQRQASNSQWRQNNQTQSQQNRDSRAERPTDRAHQRVSGQNFYLDNATEYNVEEEYTYAQEHNTHDTAVLSEEPLNEQTNETDDEAHYFFEEFDDEEWDRYNNRQGEHFNGRPRQY